MKAGSCDGTNREVFWPLVIMFYAVDSAERILKKLRIVK
jgi:hypothetical protein